MKIRALEMEQFRKFERPLRVSGFSDALNVLCGPNEFGKSTILAALRGLLFERYSSKAESVRRMQPRRGSGAPRLAMEFDLGGGCWRIEKRFLQQPSARLTGPDGRIFEADAAEEELQRLLGFGAAGKKGATTGQSGVWGALWVTQRESVDQADLSSDLARATISGCLDSEVGVLTGSEKGRSIMRAVRDQRAALLDGNDKPRGRYKEVIETLAKREDQLQELRDRARRLSEHSDAFRLATAKLAKVTDAGTVQQEQDALEDARRRREAARLFEQTRAAARAQHDLAQHQWENAERERSARDERQSATTEKEKAKKAADQSVANLRAQLDETDSALAVLRKVEAAAASRVTTAANQVRRCHAVVDLVRRAGALAGLQSSLTHAETTQNEIANLVAKLEGRRVDRDRITAIRQAVRDRDTTQSALQAQATAIDLDLEAASAGKITLGGSGITPGRQSVSVVAPTEIAIAGIGRIVVRPAIRDFDKLMARATKTAMLLDQLLTACDCRDADDAEENWIKRGELEAALREARMRLERLAPGDAPSGLEPGVEALRERVKVLSLQIEAGRQDLGLTDVPRLEDATNAMRQAENDDLTARDGLTQARADIDAATGSGDEARKALVQAESAAQIAQAELDRLRREDAEAVARESDDALAARLTVAEAHLVSHAKQLAKLDSEQSTDTVAAMDTRVERYEQAQKNREEARHKLHKEIAELRASITQEGGAGLDEAIASVERSLDALARERDVLARDAKVLTLLLDTLAASERETKERYLAPVIRRVTPYLHRLFPGAEIACDETLRVTGLSRDGSGLQEFERLSDGTQEQVAVLARLAFAELLLDQGKPAMVILDDALAYSDDERIERMFDIISQAAGRMQILVLTCREELFGRLGGNRLELVATERAVVSQLVAGHH